MRQKTEQAVKTLKEGGIILYPTEGVYGLGCDPFNETAVTRLLKLKKRKVDKGLILIAANWGQVKSLIKIDPTKQKLIKEKRGEPITWVFPATKKAPKWVTGKFKTIAIRVTTHPGAKKICQRFGGPIVSTSANLSRKKSIKKLTQVDKKILAGVDFVVPGSTGNLGKPTEICDVKTGVAIRV